MAGRKKDIKIYCRNYESWHIDSTSDDFQLVGYIDSDTYGYTFQHGQGVMAWASKKQPIVITSLAKAKYVARATTTCQAIWMQRILKDLMQAHDGLTTISSNALSNNHLFHKRTKHIDTRYHFIRELVNNKEIYLQHCKWEEQLEISSPKPHHKYKLKF